MVGGESNRPAATRACPDAFCQETGRERRVFVLGPAKPFWMREKPGAVTPHWGSNPCGMPGCFDDPSTVYARAVGDLAILRTTHGMISCQS